MRERLCVCNIIMNLFYLIFSIFILQNKFKLYYNNRSDKDLDHNSRYNFGLICSRSIFYQTIYENTVKPPNTTDLGTGEKAVVFSENGGIGSHIYPTKSLFWTAVLGGAILGGGGGRLYILIGNMYCSNLFLGA